MEEVVAEDTLQHRPEKSTFRIWSQMQFSAFSRPFPVKIGDVKTRDFLPKVEYTCPHLKGPDVTENRVVGNKISEGRGFLLEVFCAST